MAQKAITIFTPDTEDPHIYAEDDAQVHRAIFGGSGITDADKRLAATIVDNNTVRLASGLYSNMGYLHVVPAGETLALTIGSGDFHAVNTNVEHLIGVDASGGRAAHHCKAGGEEQEVDNMLQRLVGHSYS